LKGKGKKRDGDFGKSEKQGCGFGSYPPRNEPVIG
jgi:hypothetical protein